VAEEGLMAFGKVQTTRPEPVREWVSVEEGCGGLAPSLWPKFPKSEGEEAKLYTFGRDE